MERQANSVDNPTDEVLAEHAERAESVTLLLYSASDLVNPLLTFRFDFLRNKSGRIWHCRSADSSPRRV